MDLGRIVAALRRHPLVADVTLAVALAALAAVTGMALAAPRGPRRSLPPHPVIVAWAAALAAPLVLRRRWPLVVLAVTTLHFTRYWAVGQLNEIASWVILGVAVYSAAAYADRRRARWVCGACLLWLIGSGVVLSARAGPIGAVEVAAIAMFDALPFLLAWPLGVMMRRLREYRAVLEERNRQLDQEREVNARRAVLEERVRIARELHDVVAHHVSVMGMQAGVARRLFDRDPPEAVAAIGSVETAAARPSPTSRSSSGSYAARRRATTWPPAEPAAAAQAGRAHAPGRAAGRAHGPGTPGAAAGGRGAVGLPDHPGGLDQHPQARRAGPGRGDGPPRQRAVELEVVDDGRGPPPGRPQTGSKGLVGMRERVSLYGGRLDVGARPGGGFRVHAVLRSGGS